MVACKWIYKVKEESSKDEPIMFKARLVVKGFTQRVGVDFTKIFSSMIKYKTIRIMLSLVTQCGLELEQMDVKIAFLHG